MQRIETLRVLRFRREIAAYARFRALTATSVCVSRRNSVKTQQREDANTDRLIS